MLPNLSEMPIRIKQRTDMRKKIRSLFLFVIIAAVVFCGYEVKRGYDKYALALQECPLETAITKLRSKEHYTVYDDVPKYIIKHLLQWRTGGFTSITALT